MILTVGMNIITDMIHSAQTLIRLYCVTKVNQKLKIMDQLINNIVVLLFMSLSLMTWNVTGIMSSLGNLGDALVRNSVDMCGTSEHWLFSQNLFIYIFISSI